MLTSYRIDPSPPRLRITYAGHVTRPTIDALYDVIRVDPAFLPSLDCIALMDDAHFELDIQAVHGLLQRVRYAFPQGMGRLVLVATRPQAYGFARMYQSLGEGHYREIQLCASEAEAVAWLAGGG
jgi:hypothetical protein